MQPSQADPPPCTQPALEQSAAHAEDGVGAGAGGGGGGVGAPDGVGGGVGAPDGVHASMHCCRVAKGASSVPGLERLPVSET